jgi:hypothetical protein
MPLRGSPAFGQAPCAVRGITPYSSVAPLTDGAGGYLLAAVIGRDKAGFGASVKWKSDSLVAHVGVCPESRISANWLRPNRCKWLLFRPMLTETPNPEPLDSSLVQVALGLRAERGLKRFEVVGAGE